MLRQPEVVARVAKANKAKVVEELTRDGHVPAEVPPACCGAQCPES
ncbi:hypothetical protein ACWD5V_29225 [Streptomyces sp. NPDC002523]